MNTKHVRLILLVFAALVLSLLAGGVNQAAAASVPPVFTAGNPSCTSLGYDFGFKVDPPASGTYDIDAFGNKVTVTTDGVYFDWTSTLGIDAVIAKGGPNANLYIYDPPAESFGDTDLHSPINPNNGQPFGLSHIEFCFDYELDVEKTAETSFTRTFPWEIEKSVDPDTWDLFTGDSGTSEYTVTVTKGDPVDSDWAVSGTITIENNTPASATITDVSDEISGFGDVDVDCGVTFPYVLASGDSLECTYETDLPNGNSRTNTATVTTSGAIDGGEDSADVIFGNPTTVVNDTINVEDSVEGSLGSFSDTGSVSYTRTFTCDGDEGTHGNTATIVETGQSDSASVTVNCYELMVTKDADTSLTRTWTWTIDKLGDQTDLLLSQGQLFLVNYEVTVDATSADSGWAVTGNISVNNPAPIAATISSVSDIVSPNIAANVDCGVTFPYSLAASGALNCTYSGDLPDATDRTNTATATLQNYNYDSDGNATASGTTNFTKTVNVLFANATVNEIDECIDVSDTNVGVLGTVCAGDAPKTYNYSLWFGAHPDADVELVCGENTHTNIASFVTNDTGTTGSNDHTVNVTVECFLGCTLTQGYWKTHSDRGPAPYDDAWKNIGSPEEDTLFFSSGKTWYTVFWTAPAGNAYYNLAHQYMAAKLNILNGASAPAQVTSAISAAEALFIAQGAGDTSLTKAESKTALALASTLDKYNNGLIGPGHCSE